MSDSTDIDFSIIRASLYESPPRERPLPKNRISKLFLNNFYLKDGKLMLKNIDENSGNTPSENN